MERIQQEQNSSSLQDNKDMLISRLREEHRKELENLTLVTQPLKTLKYFGLSIAHFALQLFARSGKLLLPISGLAAHVHELLSYLQFGLWWLALGVASSIGLGSGLHTFVMYLGPHIALFTLKVVQCGRIDIKEAPYDTIQFNSCPSWLEENCSAFGPPLFSSWEGSRVPLTRILPQIQLEAVLWGIGTALGELPPYFISRTGTLNFKFYYSYSYLVAEV
ncbi:meiotic spindle pole body protein Kms1 [Turnera subulata]|uniref:Meiotic spindle pole body protein Kms1 n=1 Tax=Turnera subulata TaxID=218843 RepID=A0A9Q0G968_9ROSI|nr:meiotic spindle pole body protein Kms1 [Turnera subulata]